MKNKTLVFTGGHHTSALEVAKRLKSNGWKIIWYGHRHSMWGDKSDSAEYKEVVASGIIFHDLKAGKFYRTFHPLKLIRIPIGFIQAFMLLLSHSPDGIVSFGGYLAIPVVISGWILGIPSITHEQTVVRGWANRVISPFVKKIGVTWPSSLKLYPKDKAVLIGLPLRSEIINLKQSEKHATIYITGGKQGSHAINEIIFASLHRLLRKYKIIHQTGSSTVYSDYSKALQIQHSNYQAFDFSSSRAVQAFSQAEIVISRAGAHIVYELGLLGKKCVLIPIPWVSHHEQDKNAAILVKNNQAILLPQSRLTTHSLVESIEKARKLKPKPLNLPTDSTTRLVNLIQNTFS